MMTDRMNEGCLVKIGMVTRAPDKQVRVSAGGGRLLGIMHPRPLTPWLGIWVGPAELTP